MMHYYWMLEWNWGLIRYGGEVYTFLSCFYDDIHIFICNFERKLTQFPSIFSFFFCIFVYEGAGFFVVIFVLFFFWFSNYIFLSENVVVTIKHIHIEIYTNICIQHFFFTVWKRSLNYLHHFPHSPIINNNKKNSSNSSNNNNNSVNRKLMKRIYF